MKISGNVRPPGDKSITHRLLLIGALSQGRCILRHALRSDDSQAMTGALRSLGIEIDDEGGGSDRVIVNGKGLQGLRKASAALDCGNSGTTARFLLGTLAAYSFESRIVGDRSLSGRPMKRVTDPLTLMGAKFCFERNDGLPVIVKGGRLAALNYGSPVASAQIKSALILAGLAGGVEVAVEEPQRSRDHTERLLAELGQDIQIQPRSVRFRPGAAVPEFAAEVPGDMSAAAFLIAAASLAESGELVLERVGVNPTRTGLVRVLRSMGCQIEIAELGSSLGEPIATLSVKAGELRGVNISRSDVPSLIDEIPILAVLAARAQGTTRFDGVGELAFKESNRLELLGDNLRRIGVGVDSTDDSLIVHGTDKPLGGRIATGGDHRMAMAFAVLSAMGNSGVEVPDRLSPVVSYPDFFQDLSRITGDA